MCLPWLLKSVFEEQRKKFKDREFRVSLEATEVISDKRVKKLSELVNIPEKIYVREGFRLRVGGSLESH